MLSSAVNNNLYSADQAPTTEAEKTSSRDALIRVSDVEHVFDGQSGPVQALEKISLDVRPGEMVSFIGPSGCGKSTLLNIIGGLLTASGGTAYVAGEPVRGPSPKRMAYIFQESVLFPWSTILDNIKVALEFQGVSRQERDTRAKAALELVGLSDFSQSYPGQLSGGMKQRVALARALCLETEILLLDEPFAALDEQTRLVFGEEISQLLAEASKSIILVTHSLAEAVMLSDRIYVFTARPGSIKAVLEVDEPHPRKPEFLTSAKFNALRNQLYELLREEVLKAMEQARMPGARK